MKHQRMFAAFAFTLWSALLVLSTVSAQTGSATPEEVISKVREAAASIAQKGEAALAEIEKKDSPWVWKDSYVVVYNCDKDIVAAHPVLPDRRGAKLSESKDLNTGKPYAVELCKVAKNPQGGWVEYWWSKPGAQGTYRKVAYILQAGNTPYQVFAGVYDDKLSEAELNARLKP